MNRSKRSTLPTSEPSTAHDLLASQRLTRSPLVALAISFLVGILWGDVVLAVVSCILGIVAGGLQLPDTQASEEDAPSRRNGSHAHASHQSLPRGNRVQASPKGSRASSLAAPTPPVECCMTSEVTEPLDDLAVSNAAEALRRLHDALDTPERRGWKAHSTRDNVKILTRVTESGVTWGMGLGEINAPVGVVYAVQEHADCMRLLDKQYDRSRTLQRVPENMLQLDGWQTMELSFEQTLYKCGPHVC